jgi:hypothetical protein
MLLHEVCCLLVKSLVVNDRLIAASRPCTRLSYCEHSVREEIRVREHDSPDFLRDGLLGDQLDGHGLEGVSQVSFEE